MQWEHLVQSEFERMVKEEKLCIIPMAVLERHGDHLPLGMDGLTVHKVAVEASKIEPCVVFPPYYFGQVHEAGYMSGSVIFPSDFSVQLLMNLCYEIGRNGFTKILLLNGHGGNIAFLNYFMMSVADRKVPYTLYYVMFDAHLSAEENEYVNSIMPIEGGHADQWETSLMMSVAPESVRMDLHKIPEPICDIARTKKVLGRVETCFDWYASYPDYVTGSPSKASKEAGDKLMDFYIKRVAKDIKAIKQDEVTPALQKEFLEKGAKVGK